MRTEALDAAADRCAIERQDMDMDRVCVDQDSQFPAPITREPADSGRIPETVHFVVQTSGLLGHRDHVVSSLLFESRSAAASKLQQLRAAEPLEEFAIWQSSFYPEPKTWAYDVVLSSGAVMTRRNGSATWTEKPPAC